MTECGRENSRRSSDFGNFSFYSPVVSAMAVNSCEECQNVHSVVVLPDEGTASLQYELSLNTSNAVVPNTMKSDACLISEPNLLNHMNPKMDKMNNYAPCILDVDIEKGKAEIPNSAEESAGNLKSDDSIARVLQKLLQREICMQIGGKFMQLLMNNGAELPKFTSRDKYQAERVYDTPSNRSRKYKRSHSFNSRRVLLLFSVLSSMGTIILIYLTLRVRQFGDGSGNV